MPRSSDTAAAGQYHQQSEESMSPRRGLHPRLSQAHPSPTSEDRLVTTVRMPNNVGHSPLPRPQLELFERAENLEVLQPSGRRIERPHARVTRHRHERVLECA